MRYTGLVAVGVVLAALAFPGAAAATSGWQELTNPPPFDPGAMFLLTDGTVMVQDLGSNAGGSPNWWRLTPDSTGSYVGGTWGQVASLPNGYAPFAYAAAVLPDGRLIIEGGEFLNRVPAETNLGAIYNPPLNTWTTVVAPNGGMWEQGRIGDAPSEVLADGRWLLGASGWTTNNDDAILDPTNLTWTTTGGVGRLVGNGEVGFTLLPSGKVLSVDVLPPACSTRTAEAFDPATFAWSSAGETPTALVACGNANEIGPQLLMYNGKVFAEGATPATALYNATNGAWSPGPSFPVVGGQQQDASDAGSAILPDGKVLIASRTGDVSVNGGVPTHFFLFDGTSLTQVSDNATSANGGLLYMLVLPTGQVLYSGGLGAQSLEIYGDGGSPNPAWAPTVTAVPTQLAAGETYTLAGWQLNGLSDGAAFGDDYQSSTDYPLVQITNEGTGDVAYARTSNMTNRSIAPEAASCTDFTVPKGIGNGASELRVITNGIGSMPVSVTVGSGGTTTNSCPDFALATVKTGTGSGTVNSREAGISCGATCSHNYPEGTIVTLTASPTTGSTFTGWSGGGCSGTDRCIVTLDSQEAVTATFSIVPETLAVSETGDGAGSVTSSPAGISCGTVCRHDFDYGSSVNLHVSAAKDSSFHGWSGDCSGTSVCELTMTADRSVEASFVRDCLVPKLKGMRLKTARRALKAHDCSTGKIRHAFSKTVQKGRVISQKPKPHKLLEHGAKVRLTVSNGKRP